MAYKVEYITIAIMKDGTFGNINQGFGIVYTNVDIKLIPEKLDEKLKEKQKKAIIQKIQKVEGDCL